MPFRPAPPRVTILLVAPATLPPAGARPSPPRAHLPVEAGPLISFPSGDSLRQRAPGLPDDPGRALQWSLHNSGQVEGQGQTGVPGADIGPGERAVLERIAGDFMHEWGFHVDRAPFTRE